MKKILISILIFSSYSLADNPRKFLANSLEDSCDAGSGKDCIRLEDNCKKEDGESCAAMGRLSWRRGERRKAEAYFRTACRYHNEEGCSKYSHVQKSKQDREDLKEAEEALKLMK